MHCMPFEVRHCAKHSATGARKCLIFMAEAYKKVSYCRELH